MIARATFAFALVCACAVARTPDGELGALEQPNNARPAIVTAGSAVIDVEARGEGALRLIGASGEYALAPRWAGSPRGGKRAAVPLPSDAAPGAYAIEWSAGGETDRNERAVYLMPSDAQRDDHSGQYAFACVAFPADGAGTEKVAEAVKAIDAGQCAFVVAYVRGGEDRYNEALSVLDTCAAP
ncbi:MAG: hypothetical protein FJY92_10095, partial [Candidatus Hydrogenedentes bacterium]|nr:hypothetical protein [Candidatus Hydrogenedentota bacterium]